MNSWLAPHCWKTSFHPSQRAYLLYTNQLGHHSDNDIHVIHHQIANEMSESYRFEKYMYSYM